MGNGLEKDTSRTFLGTDSATFRQDHIQRDELASRVLLSFANLGYRQLDGIGCRAEKDHVFLEGSLRSYYLKQIAQTIAMKIPGVRRVTNNIAVRPFVD